MAESADKTWYVAVLIVASRVDDGRDGDPLLDLQYKLIHAPDHEAAYARALELGAMEAHSYQNSDGATVNWEFVGIHELAEMIDETPCDGAEVFSRRVRAKPDAYIRSKEVLEVFWFEANKDKTAEEILGE